MLRPSFTIKPRYRMCFYYYTVRNLDHNTLSEPQNKLSFTYLYDIITKKIQNIPLCIIKFIDQS